MFLWFIYRVQVPLPALRKEPSIYGNGRICWVFWLFHFAEFPVFLQSCGLPGLENILVAFTAKK